MHECSCGRHLDEAQREEALSLLETVGLREVVEQAIAVPDVMLSLVRHAQKSERAERLELGPMWSACTGRQPSGSRPRPFDSFAP